MTEPLLSIEHRQKPLSFNAVPKMSHWAMSKEVEEWRTAFGWLGTAQKKKIKVPVDVQVQLLHRRGNPDTGGVFLAQKGAVDGVVDAGILPNDTPAVVRRIIYMPPLKADYDALVIELFEAEVS